MTRRLVIEKDPRSKGDGSIITGDFNEIKIVDADHEKVAKEQLRIAQAIGARLVKAYNNRQWKVIVDIKGGMLIIGCDSLSNEKGYHIHMANRTLHDLEEQAVRAAGEILERHSVSRLITFNPDTIETMSRDVYDNVIGPDSAPEPI
jgi:hypothetical protein